jgi:ABC-2 type transport system ATP-binding protein
MNMMTGFISATEGTVTINGHDILDDTMQAKKQLGYLPDVPPIYGDMRVEEYLNFVCDIKKVKKSARAAMINDICATVGITDVRKRICKNLSKGYRQRVGLAQALVGYPSVLILDEPTVGLDPRQIIEMRDVIKRLGERHTILLSSHILSEVSAVCDRVMIINNGKIVASDTIGHLQEDAADTAQIVRIKGDEAVARGIIETCEGVKAVRSEACDEEGCVQFYVYFEAGSDLRSAVLKALVNAGIDVVMMKPASDSLEEIFLNVINGSYEAQAVNELEEKTSDSDDNGEAETEEAEEEVVVGEFTVDTENEAEIEAEESEDE